MRVLTDAAYLPSGGLARYAAPTWWLVWEPRRYHPLHDTVDKVVSPRHVSAPLHSRLHTVRSGVLALPRRARLAAAFAAPPPVFVRI